MGTETRPSLQARVFQWITRISMRPLFSENADIPKARRRLERLDRWGRYMDKGFERQEVQFEGLDGQWIRIPKADPQRVLLYLHGGGFCLRTPFTHGQLVARLCGQLGTTGLMPDYRLAPEFPFPAAFEDCFAVYGWLLEQGIKADQIALAGESAGGGLVLGTILQARDAGWPLPACAVMLSPWSGGPIHQLPGLADEDPVLSQSGLAGFYRALKPDPQPEHPLLDLAGSDFSGLPPLLIQAGGAEILLSDALALAEKARLAGVETTLQVYPGMPHAFQVADFLPETRAAVESIAEFVATHLGQI
jgi:monoterpene epsilon-lactone hydrolase